MDDVADYAYLTDDQSRKRMLTQKALAYYRKRLYLEALAVYEEAIGLDPNDAAAYVGKGNCLHKLKRHEFAINCYEQALTLDPKNVSAYIGMCYSYIKLGNFKAALEAHERAIVLDSKNANAYNCRGMIYRLEGQLEEALRAFADAILLSNDEDNLAGFYFNMGLTFFCDLKRYSEAMEAYEIAIRLEPEKAKYLSGKAELNAKLKALNGLEGIRASTKSLSEYLKEGEHYSSLHMYEAALRSFDRAIQIDPLFTLAYVRKGNVLLRLAQFQEALQAFEKALLDQPGLSQAHAGRGHALLALQDDMEALKAYREAILHNTDDTNCYFSSGKILIRLGDFAEAIEMFEQALRLNPQLVSAHVGRAITLFELKRYQEALSAYKQVVALDENNIEAYVSIGDIYTVLRFDKDAADAYDKALELAQNDVQPGRLWHIANPSRTQFRPPYVQFELLRLVVMKSPQDFNVTAALTGMSVLYQHLFDPQNLPAEKLHLNAQKLAHVLESLPDEDRPEALLLITGDDAIRNLQVLIMLAPFAVAGLGELAHQLTLQMTPEPRADNLFIQFYHVLDSYGVPFEDSDWLFCQELMAERLYVQARSILFDLAERRPAPDIIWLLTQALEELNESPQTQIETLQRFINVAPPADERCGTAWKCIGELYEQQLQNGMGAIKAYEQAAKYNLHFQQLDDFYSGHWDAIPTLRSHPDYAFPPVIVIDLESEYRPEAPSDPLIFEVGAVSVKGNTELKPFHALIQCDARKVAHRQQEAKPLGDVMKELRDFIEESQQSIENAIIVGHNLQEFDAPHLREMGLPIKDGQIIDTLTFARLLYPDSLQHNLSLLCEKHQLPLEEAHQALPDACACAHLLFALGNELVTRGEHLLAGFRAFVPPGSAFDRVVMQPRHLDAYIGCSWELRPEPSPARVLKILKDSSPSSQLLHAIQTEDDALIERFDPAAAYAGSLPTDRKTFVTVATRTRLEQILAATSERTDYFVLPDPRTLLCPHQLRECIEREEDSQLQLALFCLYQASHNHDAATLYPLRLPLKSVYQPSDKEKAQDDNNKNDVFLRRLSQILLEACCKGDWGHAECCSAKLAMNKAAETGMLLLATHESFLHQEQHRAGDLLIVDDLDDLQMHFAEYLAERVTDQEVVRWSADIHTLLTSSITSFVHEHGDTRAFRQRLRFNRFMPHLTRPQGEDEKSVLTRLREGNPAGEAVAGKLENFCQGCSQGVVEPGRVQAYWLDLHVAGEQEALIRPLEHWSIYGLSRDLRQAFDEICWKPFRQHILCGTAVALGARKTQFIRSFFGIPEHVPFAADQRPPHQVFIPTEQTIRPSSFLGQKPWAESAGAFVYQLALTTRQSLLVSLASSAVTKALARALHAQVKPLNRRVVSPHLDWTTAKMAERLADDAYPNVALISPYLRKVALGDRVGIELTGPLRFLNQRDPLIEAHIRAYAIQDSKNGPFTGYLLPQALLELKARMSSQADLHIILDSALRDAVYRDEVLNLFEDGEILDTLPDAPAVRKVPDAFVEALAGELDREGFSSSLDVSDDDLHEALQMYWQKDSFRTSPLDQKEVVRGVLEGKDQLVIAATGGGKSLCFQLPAILLAQDVVPKVTLVISPLIALMSDQIASLRRMGAYSAVEMNSLQSKSESEHYLQGIKRGDYSIIYIAPERVHSSALLRALRRRTIGLIAIDEAHCVSQWGHNFRTDYFVLKQWIDEDICEEYKRDFPLLAVTATARKGYVATEGEGRNREKASVEDIIEKLGLRLDLDEVRSTSPERSELELRVERIALPCPNCHSSCTSGPGEVRCEHCQQRFSLAKEDIRQAKITTLIQLLSTTGEGGLRQRWEQPMGIRQRGIVYCRTVDETVNVCREIKDALPTLRVGVYHGNTQKLSREMRDLTFRRFISEEAGGGGLDVVIATNAFGMGIDARRLGFVIHFDVPSTLEAYYQEAGRAGRDQAFQIGGDRAQCILLYHDSDLEIQRWLLGRNRITQQDIEMAYHGLHKLKSADRQEVLVTEGEIALLSGVKTDKIATCLFYLHYHTRMNGEYVLERQENAAKLKQIKFEWGYQQRIGDPVLHPLSMRLAEIFSTAPDFRLNEEQAVIIDTVELAAYLNWKLEILDGEIKNLARRQIIAIASPLFIKWTRNRKDSCAVVAQLMKDIRTLINSTDDPRALQNGKEANVAVQGLYDEGELVAVSLPIFTDFLSELAKTGAGDRQLFEAFKKNVSASGQECYKLRLKLPSQSSIVAEVMNTLMNLREGLLQAIQRFGREALADDWHSIDLLAEVPDYTERQRLNRSLRWLNILGVLTFPTEERGEIIMRVNFLQEVASSDDLKIDLTSLRQFERYGERKLALMQKYALSPPERRGQLLRAYFLGEQPLIEPFVPRQDLTDEQGALVSLTEGYHLIQGPAGSGKTTLLQEHFRYLVEHHLVPAERILVTAHFHSAVDRVGHQLDYLQSGGRPIPTKTLQSISTGIFRQHAQLLKQANGQPYFPEGKAIQLLTGTWQEVEERELALVSQALYRLHSTKGMPEYLPAHMAPLQLPDNYRPNASTERNCLKAISLFRTLGIYPASNTDNEKLLTSLKGIGNRNAWLLRDLAFYYATYVAYQFVQGEQGVYTYDDQVLFALVILRANPDVTRRWQGKYEHIIIDEFQDFTPAGAETIGILSHKHRNVIAVGDMRQRILANPKEHAPLSATFELVSDDIPVQEHRLTTNFRSVQEILDFASAVLPSFQWDQQHSALGSKGLKPTIIRVDPCILHASEHERGTGDLVQTMVDAALYHMESLPPEDSGCVAFLVARNDLSYPVQQRLQRRGRPFAVLESQHRYQTYHARRVLTYFRLIQDSNQTSEMERLLRHCVSPYFSSSQIARLNEIAGRLGMTLLDVALEPGVIEQIGATEEHLAALQRHVAIIQKHSPVSTCQAVWQSIQDLQDELDFQPEEREQADEHMQEMNEIAEELSKFQEKTVQQVLEHVDGYITFVEENRANRKLVVSTLNNAKSQDFDAVFLLGASTLKDRQRWYVSVTRARQRFYCLVDGTKDNEVLASVPKGLLEIISWPG